MNKEEKMPEGIGLRYDYETNPKTGRYELVGKIASMNPKRDRIKELESEVKELKTQLRKLKKNANKFT